MEFVDEKHRADLAISDGFAYKKDRIPDLFVLGEM